MCGDLQLRVTLSPEVFAKQLKVRTQELRQEVVFYRETLRNATMASQVNAETIARQAENLRLAEAALKDAEAQLFDIKGAYDEQVIEIERLRIELAELRKQDIGIADARFEEALQALKENRLDAADSLYQEIQNLVAGPSRYQTPGQGGLRARQDCQSAYRLSVGQAAFFARGPIGA